MGSRVRSVPELASDPEDPTNDFSHRLTLTFVKNDCVAHEKLT